VRAVSTARFETAHASRYLQQLCKHWAHNLVVEFDAERGKIVFPRDARGATWAGDAAVTFQAGDRTLDCRIDASEAGQRMALEGAVQRHLERFAFREAPFTLSWKPV